MRLVLAIIIAIVAVAPAKAADICKALALRPVPAIEDPKSILQPGQYDEAITQYRVSKKDGRVSLCSHGGYCYPAQVVANGTLVEALRLTNCRRGRQLPDEASEPDLTFYDLVVLRSRVTPDQLKVDDVDNRLLELGLCSACAGSAAYLYVHQPRSQCGRLVHAALEGNPVAIRKLQASPSPCEMHAR